MSKVVVVKYSDDISSTGCSADQYLQMLTAGLLILSSESTLERAVKKYLPNGVIGMKTNCLTRKMNSTPVNLVDALSNILQEVGTRENDIVVWERTSRELANAGYPLNIAATGRQCLGTDTDTIGYSRDFFTSEEVNSLVTRILTDIVDFNINLPVLKDHSIAGLSAGMKNMYGAIHNPNKYHGDNCSPFCAHVNNLSPIRTKNRLTVLDAIKVQYQGGPGYVGKYLSYYNGIVISDDPVAVDRIGLEILQHIRTDNDQLPLEKAGRAVKYLESAQQLGLGKADFNSIDLSVIQIDRTGRQQVGELFDG